MSPDSFVTYLPDRSQLNAKCLKLSTTRDGTFEPFRACPKVPGYRNPMSKEYWSVTRNSSDGPPSLTPREELSTPSSPREEDCGSGTARPGRSSQKPRARREILIWPCQTASGLVYWEASSLKCSAFPSCDTCRGTLCRFGFVLLGIGPSP